MRDTRGLPNLARIHRSPRPLTSPGMRSALARGTACRVQQHAPVMHVLDRQAPLPTGRHVPDGHAHAMRRRLCRCRSGRRLVRCLRLWRHSAPGMRGRGRCTHVRSCRVHAWRWHACSGWAQQGGDADGLPLWEFKVIAAVVCLLRPPLCT